mmetsp:Transcript_23125/g.45120  ORF Transcript_23125/g.45120 Transcript_23125/m.45120 type:complete len:213 (-) Transcript_23125:626-1264(-)
MAFATSLASARVGVGEVIMLSSICVATTTGLPTFLMSETMRFWTTGTWWGDSSTPRSPRATMMPSTASAMRSRSATAAGFSILAMIFAVSSPMRLRSSVISSAFCTKLNAIQSTPISAPKRASFLSFSVIALIGRVTSGTLTPFLSESLPGTTTSVSAKSGPQSTTFSFTFPSSRSSEVPGTSAAKISGWGRVTRLISPSSSLISSLKVAPF